MHLPFLFSACCFVALGIFCNTRPTQEATHLDDEFQRVSDTTW